MSQARAGGMGALIGLEAKTLEEMIQKNALKHIAISNYNSYTQLVISGATDAIAEAEQDRKSVV